MKSIKDINQANREKRRKETAEVFTPPWLTKEILDKMPDGTWREDKTFFDPSCGNGNMLVEVLQEKINRGHNPTSALKTVYGLDIKSDNIRECRLRLLDIVRRKKEISKTDIETVFHNVRWLNQDSWPEGTLSYDMSFEGICDQTVIDEWYRVINTEGCCVVNLPVPDMDFPEIDEIKFEG